MVEFLLHTYKDLGFIPITAKGVIISTPSCSAHFWKIPSKLMTVLTWEERTRKGEEDSSPDILHCCLSVCVCVCDTCKGALRSQETWSWCYQAVSCELRHGCRADRPCSLLLSRRSLSDSATDS